MNESDKILYEAVFMPGIVLRAIGAARNPLECAHCDAKHAKHSSLRSFKPYGKDARVCRFNDDECAHRWRQKREKMEAIHKIVESPENQMMANAIGLACLENRSEEPEDEPQDTH